MMRNDPEIGFGGRMVVFELKDVLFRHSKVLTLRKWEETMNRDRAWSIGLLRRGL